MSLAKKECDLHAEVSAYAQHDPQLTVPADKAAVQANSYLTAQAK